MPIWITYNKLMLIRFFSCLLKCCNLPSLVVTEGKKSQLLFWVLLGYLFAIQRLSKMQFGVWEKWFPRWHLYVKPNRWQSPFHCHIENWLRAVARAVWQKQLCHHKCWWFCSHSASCSPACGMPSTKVSVWIGSAVLAAGKNTWRLKRVVVEWREQQEYKGQHISSFCLEVFFKVNEMY